MPRSRAQTESHQFRRRRAFGYLMMSAMLPGSVQVYSGSRRLGHAVLRCWGVLWLFTALILLGLWQWRGPTVGLLLNPVFLFCAQIVVWLVAAGWTLTLIDSWRRAVRLGAVRTTRAGLTVVAALLISAMLLASAFLSGALYALSNVSSVFGGSGQSEARAGRYNILLLGGDSGPSREGLRPDSIMVASVDAENGRTILFGLPRNLENAPIPKSNPLHSRYPQGFDCPNSECLLNGLYTLAEENRELFPGVAEPGLHTMTEVASEILGLSINYYAIVDLAGFQQLIDAVGGIRLDVGRRVPIGGGSSKVSGYIEPGRGVWLDGYHALWFARSREGSDDYQRMQRQRCVLSAMAKQLNPLTVATKFNELAQASAGVLKTSVPPGDVSKLVELALKVKDQKVSSVSFVPPLIQPGKPDFSVIRKTVQQAITESSGQGSPGASTTGKVANSIRPSPSVVTKAPPTRAPLSSPRPSGESEADQTNDLAAVCAVA